MNKMISFMLILAVSAIPAAQALAGNPAVINSVTDSLGNVQTNSWGKNTGGAWPADVATPIILGVGDRITFNVDATDPDGRQLL